jgi:outer membrane protein assembly factor BamB
MRCLGQLRNVPAISSGRTQQEGVFVMRCRQYLLILAAWLAASCYSQSTARADWPSWRGPAGTGSISTGKYPTAWKVETASWKFALPGKGSSTPIVLNDRIYLTTPDNGQDAVLALDVHGKQLWLTRLGAESEPKHRTLGSSCNASPVTDGKGIFVYFRSSRLAALELEGSVRWTNDLAPKFGREKLFWDQGSSPVVTDEHVILTRMHDGESWIAGFDKATGALRWRQNRDYDGLPTENNNAYTTPVFFKHNGRAAFLVWGADHLTAHSAADGSLLWTCGQFNPAGTGYWPAIASPVVCGNLAIVPSGRDDRRGQSQVHAIRLDGSGDVTGTHRVWKREDIGVFVSSPAEYKGRIYLLRPQGNVVCLDPVTGKTIWTGSLPRTSAKYFASPVIASGVLYAAREDGVVFVARVEDQFEVVSENPMGERIVASPALADGRLLLRGDAHLFCVELAKH